MNAASEFIENRLGYVVTDYVVGGGSKWGWTSFLLAAVDTRVVGILSLVNSAFNINEVSSY